MQSKEKFGRFGALMAMAGSAVGLGNLWRFPYLLGENGGAAFLLVYILCAAIVAIPIFLCEYIIGRRSGRNCFGAFKTLSKPSSHWKYTGLIGIVTPAVIMSYYSVVGGWSVEYLFKACMFEFSPSMSKEGISNVFDTLVSSIWAPLLGHTIFLGTAMYIVSRGVKKGIESFGKVAMPALFFIVVVIAVYVAFLPGAADGYRYLFCPDFSKLDSDVIASALGQSFYSLSLGCGCILTYASYVSKDENILQHGICTSAIDLLFAMIAGCAIMPAVFAFGVDVSSGPTLVYETLPFIFSKMPGGNIIAVLFFTALIVAALTSEVSMIEVVVAYMVEERKMSRRKAVAIIFCFAWILGALCSLSFGPLSWVKIFGHGIFGVCDLCTSNVLMTVGALLTVLFAGWKMKGTDVRDELACSSNTRLVVRIYPVFRFIIRYVAPVAIILIFLSGILW